jgi:hypothetical protein
LNFQDAQFRLLAYVRDRVRNGELTERAFARIIGIAQPHMDYVLKGVRNLSVEISYPILNVFNISLVVLKPCGIGVAGIRESFDAAKRELATEYWASGFRLESGANCESDVRALVAAATLIVIHNPEMTTCPIAAVGLFVCRLRFLPRAARRSLREVDV